MLDYIYTKGNKMNKLEMIQKLEINFQTINGTDTHLWAFDLLGFIYAHLSDEQLNELVTRSDKRVFDLEQELNLQIDLAYERSVGK